jgi:hypothetical protein
VSLSPAPYYCLQASAGVNPYSNSVILLTFIAFLIDSW